MAKKKFKSKKEQYITYGIYALAIGVVVFLLWKYILKDKVSSPTETISTPGSNVTTPGPSAPTKPNAPVYTNETVFSTKNGSTKIDRVQWMQNAYNKYARNRKLFGKSPDWPTISEDGKYGSKTEAAMYRLMSKKAVSWSAVKTRTDYLQGQLNPTGFDYGN